MIALCATSRNEGDIIECWLRHMLAEGIDEILVADHSEPGESTRETLIALHEETGRVHWIDDPDPIHRQPALMNSLAFTAARHGAEWIIASDIDELWIAPGKTIAEALSSCPHNKLYARRFLHRDWDHRRIESERLPKVAFRPPAVIGNGNHEVNLPGGEHGVLEIRELHYRGFEHFKAKAKDRIATLDPAMRARGDGIHQTRLEDFTEEQMMAEWGKWLAVPTIHDPIPSRSPCRPR